MRKAAVVSAVLAVGFQNRPEIGLELSEEERAALIAFLRTL